MSERSIVCERIICGHECPVYFFYIECVAEQDVQRINPLKSGDHSEVVPLLPIPNRTVKHLSADDSADYLCESRSSPDTLCSKQNPRTRKRRGFCFAWEKCAITKNLELAILKLDMSRRI